MGVRRKSRGTGILLEQGGGILLWFLLPFLALFGHRNEAYLGTATPARCRWHWERRAILGGLIRLPLAGEETDVTDLKVNKVIWRMTVEKWSKNVNNIRDSYPGGDNCRSGQRRACGQST